MTRADDRQLRAAWDRIAHGLGVADAVALAACSDYHRRQLRATPVGGKEAAAMLGVSHQTIAKWRTRGHFPAPRWTVGGGACWRWCDVERWAIDTGRLPHRSAPGGIQGVLS